MRDDKPPRWIRKVMLNPDSMANMMKVDRHDHEWQRFCQRVYIIRAPHWDDRRMEVRIRYRGEYKGECLAPSNERQPDFVVTTTTDQSAFSGFMHMMYQNFLHGQLPVKRTDTNDDLS